MKKALLISLVVGPIVGWFGTEFAIDHMVQQAQVHASAQPPADIVVGAPWPDTDADEKIDAFDNCPNYYNPKQADKDEDGMGDECDAVCAMAYPQHDYCRARTVKMVEWYNKGETFSYYQACNADTPTNPHDYCDTETLTPKKYDDDGDRIPNVRDLCPQAIDPDQHDTDRDGIGDACDTEDTCGPRKLPCAPTDEVAETTNGLALQTVTD